jgi:hypothetical protein
MTSNPLVFKFLNVRAGGGSDSDRGDTADRPSRYWNRRPDGAVETRTYVRLEADGPWYGVSTHQAQLVLVASDGSYLPIPDRIEAVVEPHDHEVDPDDQPGDHEANEPKNPRAPTPGKPRS